VICPWGADGAGALDEENRYFSSPAYPPEKVVVSFCKHIIVDHTDIPLNFEFQDSLGAGDTFAAACIFALNNGVDLHGAINFGSRIAGAKVGFYGYDEIRKVYQEKLKLNVRV
jgi:ketohexokinase